MKTEIPFEQTPGKTIEAYTSSYSNGQFVLTFTDGTFTTLETDEEQIIPTKLHRDSFGFRQLVEAGVLTKKEVLEIEKAQQEQTKAQRETWERAQYDALKKKFENK